MGNKEFQFIIFHQIEDMNSKHKRILFVYDYCRAVAPFIEILMTEALKYFENIYYVSPPMDSQSNELLDKLGIKRVTWGLKVRAFQYLYGLTSIFRPLFWKEIFKGPLSLEVIKHVFKFFFCSSAFIYVSKPYFNQALAQKEQIYLLGTWMNIDAFTVAKLKKHFPSIKSYGLAHSGEVIKDRNPYLNRSYHEFIYHHVDKIYFISQKVLSDYLKDTSSLNFEKNYREKIGHTYLGTNNAHKKEFNEIDPQKLRIVTCSRIDSNKRLNRIIESLRNWDDIQIHWVHFGSGELEKEIIKEASLLTSLNPKITVEFKGQCSNKAVLDYYETHPVDLFINVSLSEGLPISIMEAMSFAIPTIATDVGGTSEIVNSSNGFLLTPMFSNDEFVATLTKFTKLTLDERDQLSHSAFKTWQNNFNAEVNAKELYMSWFNS